MRSRRLFFSAMKVSALRNDDVHAFDIGLRSEREQDGGAEVAEAFSDFHHTQEKKVLLGFVEFVGDFECIGLNDSTFHHAHEVDVGALFVLHDGEDVELGDFGVDDDGLAVELGEDVEFEFDLVGFLKLPAFGAGVHLVAHLSDNRVAVSFENFYNLVDIR